MENRKTVLSFIRPNIVLAIILLLIPLVNFFALIVFLCATLPAILRANKSIRKLEANGEIDTAATELTALNSKRLMKGKLILSDHYVFCKSTGYVFTYDEILWAYKHRQTSTFFLIPIKITDSLYLATKDKKPGLVASMGKDKLEEIKNAIVEIYNHNPNCLIGYSAETNAKYKELVK